MNRDAVIARILRQAALRKVDVTPVPFTPYASGHHTRFLAHSRSFMYQATVRRMPSSMPTSGSPTQQPLSPPYISPRQRRVGIVPLLVLNRCGLSDDAFDNPDQIVHGHRAVVALG